jgi:hypothetical protein
MLAASLQHRSFVFRKQSAPCKPCWNQVFFPKAEALRENRRQETKVEALLADAPLKGTLQAEVEARAKSVKCNRLFLCYSPSHMKTRVNILKFKCAAAHDTTRRITHLHKTHHNTWVHRRGYALDWTDWRMCGNFEAPDDDHIGQNM